MRRLLLMLPALVLAGCSAFGVRGGTGEPAFTRVETVGPAEIRHYGARAAGATHWSGGRFTGGSKGAKHAFFFAPAQFAKRDADWGPGEALRKTQAESARMAGELKDTLTIRRLTGAAEITAAWSELVAGEMPPQIGVMAALRT